MAARCLHYTHFCLKNPLSSFHLGKSYNLSQLSLSQSEALEHATFIDFLALYSSQSGYSFFFFNGQCLIVVIICWVLLYTRNLTQTISNPYSNPAKSGLSSPERQRHSYEYHITYNILFLMKDRDNGNGSYH